MKNPMKFYAIATIVLLIGLICLELFLKKKVSYSEDGTAHVSTFGSKKSNEYPPESMPEA